MIISIRIRPIQHVESSTELVRSKHSSTGVFSASFDAGKTYVLELNSPVAYTNAEQ